ncbi:MAG TPA: tRNA preQ1(34) S-adenosylmethionine ribosyltransferase-isomerase QueA [Syntrophales bacterium]|nr:tRNA preQ1(34) S-adenosylmethionine ribosyltransferase-isomerase QueA [Syntrophales bacterium]HOX95474.1 tRNA preQ1(34) S-adenosylmethionine ribosyltransferase-isomerase QueA [Syntrophales bacterium]HPI56481.1 tRNA preQ1(34) S-adenosylmethionine ribosyltransferase-isomerase QueA [Syntrophales bacterium]HPN25098.1 tRNA preQ1(34) S-adenosylmethionine ribosyltransferase-isomerase QueA [Syntrophales bacterium]HQM29159.1 tRNA preQ1(34) S-adenosylmethionine ribosyltransferase-isomerase QueA [Syntr
MKLTEFDYDLPEELIAQEPAPARDHSRMMVLNRGDGSIKDRRFYELPEHLTGGDVLVINDSRVIPARLVGRKASGGLIEILLLRERADETAGSSVTWEVLLRPARRADIGRKIFFDAPAEAEIIERLSEKKWVVRFDTPGPFTDFLNEWGRAPLPPYIKRDRRSGKSRKDLERYQTVYARVPGSVAAPTAGLHFSDTVLERIRQKGVAFAAVTLHVGYGTFLPIESQNVEDHRMEEEFFEMTEEAAATINGARRVVAVGTTAVRVIESTVDDSGRVAAASGSTRLFIHPGYRFRRVGALLTNFHLPKSSLYLLVCAFAGRDLVRTAYGKAIEEKYRFYSYGDCMLIL